MPEVAVNYLEWTPNMWIVLLQHTLINKTRTGLAILSVFIFLICKTCEKVLDNCQITYILFLPNSITFNEYKARAVLLRQHSKGVANHSKSSYRKLLKCWSRVSLSTYRYRYLFWCYLSNWAFSWWFINLFTMDLLLFKK